MVCSTWRWKRPSKFLSLAYIKQILTPHPQSVQGQGGGLWLSSLAQTRKGKYKGESQPYLESTEGLPIVNFTTTGETERRGNSIRHVEPPIVSLEILQVAGEATCRAGWYFFSYANPPVFETAVCFPLNLKFTEAKGHVSLLHCAGWPTHDGWFINVTWTKNGIFPRSLVCFHNEKINT